MKIWTQNKGTQFYKTKASIRIVVKDMAQSRWSQIENIYCVKWTYVGRTASGVVKTSGIIKTTTISLYITSFRLVKLAVEFNCPAYEVSFNQY